MFGAEDAQSARAEKIDDPSCKRVVRTDHRKMNLPLFGKVGELLELHDADGHVFSEGEGAAVARRDVELPNSGRLFQFPRERVFPPAASHEKNVNHAFQYTAFPPPAYPKNGWRPERPF